MSAGPPLRFATDPRCSLPEALELALPRATIVHTPPLAEDGIHLVDVRLGDRHLIAEFCPRRGYALSGLEREYGEGVDEVFDTEAAIVERAVELLRRDLPPHRPDESDLRWIRRASRRSAREMARALGISLPAYEQFEASRNPTVSRLSKFAAAVGGELEIVLKQPGRATALRRLVAGDGDDSTR